MKKILKKVSPRLSPSLLISIGRLLNRGVRRHQDKAIDRLTSNRQFTVWEMPYQDVGAIKFFIDAMHRSFPEDRLFLHLFVNHTAHLAFASVGFDNEYFQHALPLLDTIVGVTQTFVVNTEHLLALSVHGVHDYVLDVTAKDVDRIYAAHRKASA